MNRTEDFNVLTPEATIAELAQNVADRHKHKKKTLIPAVPFMAVMAVFTIGVFCLAIIPTCVQVFSSASGSIDNLSGQIVKSVILSLSFQLQQMMGAAKSSMDTYGQLALVKQVLSNTTENYGDNLELIRLTETLMINAPVPVSFICVQNYNATGRAPTNAPGKPVATFSSVYYDSNLMWNYCDYRDLSTCYVRNYNTLNSSLTPPQIFPSLTPENAKGGFLYQKLSSCGSQGSWKSEAFQGFGWMSYAKCAPPNERGISPYACGGAFSTLQLPFIMSFLAPTVASRVWLTTVDGKMISSNLNATEYPILNAAATDFTLVNEFKDKTIQELSKKLLEGKKSWTDINTFDASAMFMNPVQKVPTVEYTLSDGKRWITIALVLTFGTPERFYLMVSIPHDDFFGLVDASIRNGITLSSVFSVLGVITGLVLTFLMVMPMQRLTNNMKMVTKFDFSMLQSGVLREDSLFTEVRHMQNTFNTMVKAFAGAIQVNKRFNSRTGLSSNGMNYSYQAGSASEFLGVDQKTLL